MVFYVREGIEERCEELKKRRVRFLGRIDDDPFGRTVHSKDTDGHELFLWRPPSRGSENFKHVPGIVNHCEGVLPKLEK